MSIRLGTILIGGALLIGLLLLINHWRVEAGKVDGLETQITTLSAQIIAEREQVKKNQELTANVEGNYAKKISNLNANLKRLRDKPATCVAVQPATETNGGNGAASGGIPARPNGILDSKLIDFAGEAETYRLRLLGCQDFINQVYKANP